MRRATESKVEEDKMDFSMTCFPLRTYSYISVIRTVFSHCTIYILWFVFECIFIVVCRLIFQFHFSERLLTSVCCFITYYTYCIAYEINIFSLVLSLFVAFGVHRCPLNLRAKQPKETKCINADGTDWLTGQ